MSKRPGTLGLRVTANNSKELYRTLQEAAGLPSLVSLSDEALLEELKARRQKLQVTGQLPRAAHDVNNMLSVIVSSLEMLLKAPQGSERFRALVERSIEAALKSAELMRVHGHNSVATACGSVCVDRIPTDQTSRPHGRE
jgi:hypothetical protein